MQPEDRIDLQKAVDRLNEVVRHIANRDAGRTRLRGWCRHNEATDGFTLSIDVSTGRETIG